MNLIIFCLLVLGIDFALGACPTVVTRAEWGAAAHKNSSTLTNPLRYAFIHHGASGECTDRATCSAKVRSYQTLHMQVNKWDDIGYSYVIGGDGAVYEGRGWDKVGAHTKGYNSVGYGFCFIGNFMSKLPTAAALQAAKDMIACGVTLGKIQPNYTLRGHRDMVSTQCPGDTLYTEIKTWPHY
ncbi:peptidoglycan recognition protein 1-like [Physella acuta]|uniref:peptidoglycan recognition protein 1-like n=1 Tax=Physella acuta TaxID=109671 RepID=UPI0027DB074C|nr:peptidoglycan recognition protein 1-like [Physella acuta]